MNIASQINRGEIFWANNRSILEKEALTSAKMACEGNVLCLGVERAFVKLNTYNQVWDIQKRRYGFLHEGDASEGIALQKCMQKVEGVAQVIIAVVVPEKKKSYTVMESFAFAAFPLIPIGFEFINFLHNPSLRTIIQAAKVLQALNGCGTQFKVTTPFAWINLCGEILIHPSAFADKEDTKRKEPREALLQMAAHYGWTLNDTIQSCNPADFWNSVIETLEKMHEEELKSHFLCKITDTEMVDLRNSIPKDLPSAAEVPTNEPGQSFNKVWSAKRLPNRGQITERFLLRGPLLARGCYKDVYAGVLCDGKETYKVAIGVFNKMPKSQILANEMVGAQAAGHDHVLSYWEVRNVQSLFESVMVPFPKNLEQCLMDSILSYDTRIEMMRQASIGLANFQAALKRIYVDFKPANILIDRKEDGSFHAVLGDLGGSGEVGKHNCGTGTPLYGSPEHFQARFDKGMLGYSHDAWSFGATLLEVISGATLESGNMHQINHGNMQYMSDWIAEVNALTRTLPADKIGNLIRKCLYSDSWGRPQVSELEKLIREG